MRARSESSHRFEGIIVIAIARWCSVLVVSVASSIAYGGGIDHRIGFDDTGVWNRNVQRGVEFGTIAVVVGGASWLGGDDRLGRTFWQAFDSGIVSSAGSEAMKHSFTRARPSQTDDPDEWFKGHGHYSFPSGEVALVAGSVAPFVFEYGREYPMVYGLELLTVYDMVARVKTQSHWQSDVLASAALGTAVGYYMHRRDQPFTLGLMPHGVQVGLRKQF